METEQILEVLSKLVSDFAIIYASVFLYAIIRYEKANWTKRVVAGLIIGLLAVLIMANPWILQDGIHLDGRSVLLSISGVFFGLVPTAIAAAIAVVFRIIIGGTGLAPGIIMIFLSSGLGLLLRLFKDRLPKINYFVDYFLYGLIVHGITLLTFLVLPFPETFVLVKILYIPFLTVLPVVTMIVGVIIEHLKEESQQQDKIYSQQLLLQASIDSIEKMEFFAVDTKYNYLAINDFHVEQMKRFYQKDIKLGDNYLSYLTNADIKQRVKKWIDRALLDEHLSKVFEIEDNPGKFLEEHYTPIKDKKGVVIGVSVRSLDYTKRYQKEQKIFWMSYYDGLTNLYNKRSFEERLVEFDQQKNLPLSVIYIDVNGLKITNDALGHDVGDELLILVSKELVKQLGFDSFVARTGGDEFTIILPKTTKEEAEEIIKQVRTKFQNTRFHHVTISVSMGLATKKKDEDIYEVIKEAETNMYANKLIEAVVHGGRMIKTFQRVLYQKFPEQEMHAKRVSELSVKIGKKLGLDELGLKRLETAALLHDVGKISIIDSVLTKTGKLTEEDKKALRKHPEIGYRIMATIPEYSTYADYVLSHHEHYDGSGYPRGIKGDEIPLGAKIISLANVYDSMTNKRPHKTQTVHQFAVSEIKSRSNTQFDPVVVKAFLDLFEN